jgi:hypothetical protein
MKKPIWLAMIATLVLSAIPATSQASTRGSHKFGVFGDYHFGSELTGVNVAINATDWVRLQLGYAFNLGGGNKYDAQLQGAGLFFVPQWDFSPFVGLGSGPSSGTLSILLGLDYTTQQGWNFGAGWAQVNTSGASGTFIYVGYYF